MEEEPAQSRSPVDLTSVLQGVNKGEGRSRRGRGSPDLWYYPPQPKFTLGQPPKPLRYFASRILMWMPRRLWAARLIYPHKECNGQELTSAGIYPTVRHVVDIDGYYNLAGEYLECRRCHRKVISWSQPILRQLDIAHRLQFPIILTHKWVIYYIFFCLSKLHISL